MGGTMRGSIGSLRRQPNAPMPLDLPSGTEKRRSAARQASPSPRARGPLIGGLQQLWRWLTAPQTVLGLLLVCLLSLPLAMASTFASAAASQMEMQADEISTLATSIRSYYADNVIARLQAADGKAVFSENYRQLHGGIPIPATLSIELGALFDSAHNDGRIDYDFISDYPFAKRAARPLDSFETDAITAFRADSKLNRFSRMNRRWFGKSSYRLATPVYMRKACVTCHNSHPDSPKRDWKVGDVRGIQEVSVKGLEVKGFDKFSYLLGYVGLLGLVSVGAAASFQRQAADLERSNRRLQESNERETSMSDRLRSQVSELSLLGEVVENATFGVTIADMRRQDAPLIYVNEAFSEITGYPKEIATGYNCRFLRGPETDPAIVAEIRRALREGKPCNCVLLNYRMDGTTFWNRLTLYPVGGVPGRPDFYVGNQVDVTALLESEGRSHSALAGMKDPLNEAMLATREATAFSRQLFSKLSSRELLTEDLRKFFEAEFAALNKLEAHLGDTANLLDGFDANSEAILSNGNSAVDS